MRIHQRVQCTLAFRSAQTQFGLQQASLCHLLPNYWSYIYVLYIHTINRCICVWHDPNQLNFCVVAFRMRHKGASRFTTTSTISYKERSISVLKFICINGFINVCLYVFAAKFECMPHSSTTKKTDVLHSCACGLQQYFHVFICAYVCVYAWYLGMCVLFCGHKIFANFSLTCYCLVCIVLVGRFMVSLLLLLLQYATNVFMSVRGPTFFCVLLLFLFHKLMRCNYKQFFSVACHHLTAILLPIQFAFHPFP